MAIGKIEVMAKSFYCARHYHLTDNLQAPVKSKSRKMVEAGGFNSTVTKPQFINTGMTSFIELKLVLLS